MNTPSDMQITSNSSELSLAKIYDPSVVENAVYESWLSSGCFHANENTDKPTFTIVIPPPNVTGMLTMGHVLNNTLQDILIRFHRMKGEETLWLPGTDHAGIATQNVVEKALAKEHISRHDLGREKFLERVWAWKEKYGGIIISQLKKLGCSCDWERECFTMDESLSKAVLEAFVRLYNDGLIYKGKYIINWCPRCRTALSDEEKIPEEQKGSLWYIRYPIKNTQSYVIVATTRPETMLGDTAVAVNPDDDRFRHLVGQTLILPLMNREIPIVADDYVDPKFGTGAVKVTPAHDPNDFEIGRRHNLQQIVIMDEGGIMNESAGAYAGLDRFVAREKIIADLQELGLFEKREDHTLAVGHCERCHTIIEPYLSDQWFVKMKPLAEKAIAAVKNGTLRFTPERWVGVYLHWMENIRDWCISRQLWWGHRIPAYTCEHCGTLMVDNVTPTVCSKCGKSDGIKQEEDVLDTWFSSWLWPFSTMGWPARTKTLEVFYPTDVLITGPDIIFFWVARMVMAGYYFMGECPFHDVYFTSIVRDIKGRKMSKSLGNSPDPLDIIARYGADALRFTIVWLAPVGQDIRFSVDKVEIGRNFANKLWNASRFTLMNISNSACKITDSLPPSECLTIWDRWILSRLQQAVGTVHNELLEGRFRFNEALKAVYEFIWNELCDWYIEMSKGVLIGPEGPEKDRVRNVLLHTLDTALRLLHPFMPFITEEIWRKLPGASGHLMQADFPDVQPELVDTPLEAEVNEVMETVRVIRNLRASADISPSKRVIVRVVRNRETSETIERHKHMICALSNAAELEIVDSKPSGHLVGLMGTCEICIDLAGMVDVIAEKKRITLELAKIDKELSKISGKLEDQNFVAKAPSEIVENIRSAIESYNLQKAKLQEYLNELEKL